MITVRQSEYILVKFPHRSGLQIRTNVNSELLLAFVADRCM